MAITPEEFEDLSPSQARYRLAETKLRLLNALAKLEMMERDLTRKANSQRTNENIDMLINFQDLQSKGSSNNAS